MITLTRFSARRKLCHIIELQIVLTTRLPTSHDFQELISHFMPCQFHLHITKTYSEKKKNIIIVITWKIIHGICTNIWLFLFCIISQKLKERKLIRWSIFFILMNFLEKRITFNLRLIYPFTNIYDDKTVDIYTKFFNKKWPWL